MVVAVSCKKISCSCSCKPEGCRFSVWRDSLTAIDVYKREVETQCGAVQGIRESINVEVVDE